MKWSLIALIVAAAACGGSESGGQDLSKFEGSPWNTNLTMTVTCGSQSQNGSALSTISFGPASAGADLQYTSQDGCTFQFIVAGNTATLSNAPVSCGTTVNGATLIATFNNYAATTSDGHNLTIASSGSAAVGGTTCSTVLTGTGTR
jgi:hypothetical protein